MNQPLLPDIICASLNDNKAKDILVLDVSASTTLTDTMIIATGTSTRHVKAIAKHLQEKLKSIHGSNCKPVHIEGETQGEWVLIDCGEAIIHIMLASAREFYDLESLWSVPFACDSND